MKKIFLYICMLFFNLSSYCQITGIYGFEVPQTDMTCDINLYNDGRYLFELEYDLSTDIIESFILSYGNYRIINNEIIFTDWLHGYLMKMRISKDGLYVSKSFVFLRNKTLSYWGQNVILESTFDFLFLKNNEKKRISYENKDTTLYFLSMGKYLSKDFELHIENNRNYRLKCKNMIVSNGNWKQERNILILNDTILKHSFQCIIEDSALISNLLPCDYYPWKLVLKYSGE